MGYNSQLPYKPALPLIVSVGYAITNMALLANNQWAYYRPKLLGLQSVSLTPLRHAYF